MHRRYKTFTSHITGAAARAHAVAPPQVAWIGSRSIVLCLLSAPLDLDGAGAAAAVVCQCGLILDNAQTLKGGYYVNVPACMATN